MIFYVKFDPINHLIVDYSNVFDEDKHIFYLSIDINKEYNEELAYIHQSYRQGNHYRPAAHSISIKTIKSLLIEKIRNDKLDYLIK